MNSRKVSVFRCPTPLYDEIKTISEQELISVSALCRRAVKTYVDDYKSYPTRSDDLSDESNQLQ